MSKKYKFPQYIARQRRMKRWSLMHSVHIEDLQQHSYEVATIAHLLCNIWNNVFGPQSKGGFMPLDAALAAVYALFHDAAEVFTGDFPTPMKEFGGGVLKAFSDTLETMAVGKMVSSLPVELRESYQQVFEIPARYKKVIKAADRIAALNKCREELAAGNPEFGPAAARIEQVLKECELPEVQYYLEHFLTDKPMTLDELIEGNGAWLLDNEGESL